MLSLTVSEISKIMHCCYLFFKSFWDFHVYMYIHTSCTATLYLKNSQEVKSWHSQNASFHWDFQKYSSRIICYYWLTVSAISKRMHCRILINMITFFTIAAMLGFWILITNVLVVRGKMWWVYLIVSHAIRSCVLIINRYLLISLIKIAKIAWLIRCTAELKNLLSFHSWAWLKSFRSVDLEK